MPKKKIKIKILDMELTAENAFSFTFLRDALYAAAARERMRGHLLKHEEYNLAASMIDRQLKEITK